MQYTEDNDIPGILMMIDFEKAFDTVSWKFIHKCLDFFNFGSSIKKWISTFQKKHRINSHPISIPLKIYHNLIIFNVFTLLLTLFSSRYSMALNYLSTSCFIIFLKKKLFIFFYIQISLLFRVVTPFKMDSSFFVVLSLLAFEIFNA